MKQLGLRCVKPLPTEPGGRPDGERANAAPRRAMARLRAWGTGGLIGLALGCGLGCVPVEDAAAQGTPSSSPPPAAAPALGAPRAVQAPFYGDVLFNFYLDDHFEAASRLMVSQHFARLAPHDDEAELLRGGLFLSWGLHQEATAVFERLLEAGAPAAVHDRAWLQLAKIRYQRGLAEPAQAALARIGQALPAPLAEERALLQARLLMGRGEHAAAAEVLQALPRAASAFARFNLAVALVKAGERPAGLALLENLGLEGAADEETRALRDRANVALGYTALHSQQPADARRALQRVRLNGPESSKALLAYGWADLALGEPRQALVPLGELLVRPLNDPAVLEAQIAVPYALAQAGAAGHALERYDAALAAFNEERRALAASAQAIQRGALVQALLQHNPRAGMGWLGGIEQLPASAQWPHAAHLAPVMATHEFQEGFKNLHDLVFLDTRLRQWQQRLDTYADMLALRQRAFADKLPAARAATAASQLQALAVRRQQLQAELDQAEATQDAAVVADARQRALLGGVAQALARVRTLATGAEPTGTAGAAGAQGTASTADTAASATSAATAAAPAVPAAQATELAEVRERLRRVQAALTWQLQEDLADRVWQQRKALRQIDGELTTARTREAALARAQTEEPQRHAALAARLQALAGRTAALLPRIAALRAEQGEQLQNLALAALREQGTRLDDYAAQARLGMAQLHDAARLAANPGPATAPAAAVQAPAQSPAPTQTPAKATTP